MKKPLLTSLITALLASIVACSSLTTIAPRFPYDLMVGIQDLPPGYERANGEFPEVQDGISHFVTYSNNKEKSGYLISHQVTMYPSSEMAQRKYPIWIDQWTTDSWKETGDIQFTPRNPADTFTLKCLDVVADNSPMKSCSFIQLHKNLVALIVVNFAPGTMTYKEFEEVLVKLDQRLPAEEINYSEYRDQ